MKTYDFSKGKRGAVLPVPPGKERITIRLDCDILDYFRDQVERAGGGNYQTVINNVLRDYIEGKKSAPGLEDTLRRLANKTSPTVPMKFTTMEAMLSEDVAMPRFRTLLLAVFAGLSICLSMVGLYGVMAYTVGQRSNEIGLRIALGASRGSVLRLVLRQALILVSTGVALGLAIAMGVTRLFTTVLFEVKPTDPFTFIAVSLLLIAVASLACYIPARRATKVDPMVALRYE